MITIFKEYMGEAAKVKDVATWATFFKAQPELLSKAVAETKARTKKLLQVDS